MSGRSPSVARFRPVSAAVPTTVWLASLALAGLSAACGDSSENQPGGGGGTAGTAASTAGTSPTAGSGAVTAGSAAGGAPNAGGSSGGAAGQGNPPSGGAPNGGAAAGGATTGGSAGAGTTGGSGGAPNGGTANGGAGGGGGGSASKGSIFVPDPSWTCGKADGIVDPTLGELVFKASINVGQVRNVGATQFGERRVADLINTSITSTKLEATLLTAGIDFELKLSNGAMEIEQVAMLRAKDNSLIYMRNCGIAPAGDSVVRIVPDFEVANSSALAWLNTGKFAGTRTLDATGKKVELAVYDVTNVPTTGTKLQFKDPDGVPHNPWECIKATGTQGAEVFTENVTLGGSLSVGASKRGTRNVIPITGGTVTGKFAGSIMNAGADYQILSGAATLDARYVLYNDTETVVVRNCGPSNALVPLFEARSAGAYGFLNTGKFISSPPGGGAGGGVKITFYELK